MNSYVMHYRVILRLIKGKGNVFPVHDMEAHRRSRDVALLAFNLGGEL